jgi:peroxiredoxin
MIRTLLTATLFLMATPVALAGPAEEAGEAMMIGPETGALAPEFSALSASGTPVGLSDISASKGAVLVFSRSLDWCPYCKKQSIDLIEATAPLAEAGWQLNLITYDAPETLATYAASEKINYALLSDTGSAMIDAFNLRNHDMPAGSRYDGIPHPAIVFIAADGTVEAVLREEGYKNRPPVETVLETVQSLNTGN